MKGYGRGLYQQENLKKCMSSIFSKAIKEAGPIKAPGSYIWHHCYRQFNYKYPLNLDK